MFAGYPKGGAITTASTNQTVFPETGKCMALYLSTPDDNAGTITLTNLGGTGGLILGAGVGVTLPIVNLGAIAELSALAYQASNSGDVLNYLLLR